jgi:antitoxin (DNA-binding transcriptional repressor) of toxin-antitoxin stability system
MRPERGPRTVKIAELKNRLSYYLRRVQRGEAILVCDRDRVIARIERVSSATAPGSDAEWLDRLERRGVIRRGTGKLAADWLARRPVVRADAVGALLRDREEGP